MSTDIFIDSTRLTRDDSIENFKALSKIFKDVKASCYDRAIITIKGITIGVGLCNKDENFIKDTVEKAIEAAYVRGQIEIKRDFKALFDIR